MNGNTKTTFVKNFVDTRLRAIFADRQREAAAIGQRYELFWQRLEHVAMSGGKRIRPFLTTIGYGSIDDKIIPVAVAQELVHIAMLVHDDIIDQDDMRHGEKNANGLYYDDYQKYLDHVRALHYANSSAILAGDALLSEAYNEICQSEFDSDIKHMLTRQLHLSINEVIGGELMDVEAAFVHDTFFDAEQIYRYKTSSYSFIGPLLSGAYCSNADTKTITALHTFATNAGIGFQIQDDLLGVFGDEQQTGKSTLTDLREGKRTLLVSYHQQLMNATMQQHFKEFGNGHAKKQDLEQIKHDMEQSGARQKTAVKVEEYFLIARDSLNELHDARQQPLLELLCELSGRKK